jgi:hypothetical protein
MKINDLFEDDDDGFVKKADKFMRGSFAQNMIDKLQAKTGFAGPAAMPSEEKPKKKEKSSSKKTKNVKQPKKKNEKINVKNPPLSARFKDDNGVSYVYNSNTEKWHPDDDNRPTLNAKEGGIMYNKTPKERRAFIESQQLNEGGNIFQGTSDFDHKLIPDMMKQINSVMSKTGVKALPIGSGATPTPGKISGDLDMIADAGQIRDHFGVKDNKNAKIELEKLFQQAGFETKKTGQIVHVKTNVGDSSQQVDIMVVDGGETAQKFHVHDIPKGSPYKGVHKQIMIADLAKEKGYKWSPYKGLVNRETNELVSSNLDEIAKLLINDNATAKDLGSVESIVKAMGPAGKEFLQNLEADPESPFVQKKVKVETLGDKHLSQLKRLLP